MSNELTTQKQSVSIFGQFNSMEDAWKAANNIAQSQLVPESFRGKPHDVLIALDQAQRLGMSPIMVLQNTHIIKGKASLSSSFLIACLNASGRFNPINFVMGIDGNANAGKIQFANKTCKVVTTDKNGNEIEGPIVDLRMAVAEGWYTKDRSKWPTMPDLMLRYRAAAFFARLYAPDITMGMSTKEEAFEYNEPLNEVPALVDEPIQELEPIIPETEKPQKQKSAPKKNPEPVIEDAEVIPDASADLWPEEDDK